MSRYIDTCGFLRRGLWDSTHVYDSTSQDKSYSDTVMQHVTRSRMLVI